MGVYGKVVGNLNCLVVDCDQVDEVDNMVLWVEDGTAAAVTACTCGTAERHLVC